MKGQPFLKRLGFAIQGFYLAFRRERSIRFHVVATIGVFLALLAINPPAIWWAMSALTIGVVIMAELFNSALETLTDHLHPEQHPEIGAVKDIAACAVLITAVAAVIVALAFILR